MYENTPVVCGSLREYFFIGATTMKNEFKTRNNITKMIVNSPTYGRVETLIDKEDIEKIKKHIWRACLEANKKSYRFATGQNINTKLLHRYIMNCPTDKVVDHINRNPLDNRKCNLRICTQYENIANRHNTLSKQSGYKYVYWNKTNNQWVVRIQKKYHQVYCGCRKKLEDAVLLRDKCLNEG